MISSQDLCSILFCFYVSLSQLLFIVSFLFLIGFYYCCAQGTLFSYPFLYLESATLYLFSWSCTL